MFTPSHIASVIGTVGRVFSDMLPGVGLVAGISDTTLTKVTSAVEDLNQAVGAFAASDSAESAKPALDRIEADTEAVLTSLAALPLPLPLAIGMRVAQAILPGALASAKLLFPSTTQ